MRVAIVNLTSGGLSGGYRKYLQNLVPLLASDRRIAELAVFVPAAAGEGLPRGLDVRPFGVGAGGRADVARAVDAMAPDVVFVPTARRLDVGALPVVTMVRNMEPLTVPFSGNSIREGLKNLARAWEARSACRGATRVIAVSGYVRDYVVGRWGLDPHRVGIVYHGTEAPTLARTDTAARRVIVTAGSIRPARGLEDIIRALPHIAPDVSLLIAGRVDEGCEQYAARLRRLGERLAVTHRMSWVGHLDAPAMTNALAGAALFVMTSRAEACPNIALEAMSCGTPAVAVDHAPMPEFFADAALYYPEGDGVALASRVRSLLDDGAERARLAEAGNCRARAFTWESTRDRTIEELARALA